jgi:ATP-dependent helicase HepA
VVTFIAMSAFTSQAIPKCIGFSKNTMINPQIGQRWLVDTDASLGLGIITAHDARQVTIDFPAVGQQRQYSINTAPLTKVTFSAGDKIHTQDGREHEIERVEAINHLMIYINQEGEPIPETQLAANMRLNHPLKRLLAGQVDNAKWFSIREQLLMAQQRWRRSGVIGLLGARVTLNPHQLYVAHTATSRFPVRALLADEVGLGKTIEAGLILKRLQYQHGIARTLILVPEALCVQWFVELLRGFAIHCALVDEATDFEESRVFIAAHGRLAEPEPLTAYAWDLVIVDEAHHFDLTQPTPLADNLRQLADATVHLVLLSATPERLGLESHFRRLQLLNPDTFHDFAAFKNSAQRYQTLAGDLKMILDGDKAGLKKSQLEAIQRHFQITVPDDLTKDALVELLLDSHGTGRTVFRNTRHSVPGFVKRRLVRHELRQNNSTSVVGLAVSVNHTGQSQPSVLYDEVHEKTGRDHADAKRAWLRQFIRKNWRDKTLLITRTADEVLELKAWLFRTLGMDFPVFHEEMTLIERDRAAAYFADSDDGAPLLLCSEIGSEGRNFQFCHRLICWDLPEHPDVLEQRIGRLDRIGQTQDIEIHVCVDSDASELRLQWYHDLLNAIETINPAAGKIHDEWYQRDIEQPDQVAPLIRESLAMVLAELEQGRDALLELNSCRQPGANQLVEAVQRHEQENDPQALLEKIVHTLNLHYEQISDRIYHLAPSDQMLVAHIPWLPAEGASITYDRAIACSREDVSFVTWEHPLMQGLFELITLSELGVASISLLPSQRLAVGTVFAEVLYDISVQSAERDHVLRYLTESTLRIVVTTGNEKNIAASLPTEQLDKVIQKVKKSFARALIRECGETITSLFEKTKRLAEAEMAAILENSLCALADREAIEVARLEALACANPAITNAEITELRGRYANVAAALRSACQLSLNAIRLVVTTQKT